MRCWLSWILFVSAASSFSFAADEPLHRYKLILALDQSFESGWLRSEMDRDWTRPNPDVVLTPEQQREVRIRGSQLNTIMARLREKFIVTIVNDCPPEIRMPAICIGGKWESINRRAFVKETDPLLTLDWYHREHDWAVGRPADEGDWKRYWYVGPRPFPPWLADEGEVLEMYQDGIHTSSGRRASQRRSAAIDRPNRSSR
jgi:hypothetical protein